MGRTIVVTGAASGIGAATTRILRDRGDRVIAADLHDADVIADLATAAGRCELVEGVRRLSDGKIDAIVANAGGGPPETSLSLNFFGAVATLEGLRPLLETSPAPRAVAVSSISSLRASLPGVVEACLAMDEEAALAAAQKSVGEGMGQDPGPLQASLDLYATAKQALQRWIRRTAILPAWAGAGIALNAVALGFFDTPGAATALTNPEIRNTLAPLFPLRGAFPGRAEEAGEVLTWFISPANAQMTGQILYVDGGFECRAREGGMA